MRHSSLTVTVHENLLRQILDYFRFDGNEHGGLIFLQELVITGCYQDAGFCTNRTYLPGDGIRAEIAEALRRGNKIALVHSHSGGGEYKGLSTQDIQFAREFLRLNPCFEYLLMALVVNERLLLFKVNFETVEAVIVSQSQN